MAKSNTKKTDRQIRTHCRQVRTSLVDHLEHQLPPEEQRMVDEHLKVCPRCAAERASLKQTLTLLNYRELPEPDESFWMELRSRVRQGIREEQAVSGRRPAVPIRAWVPAVAVASLLVFLFLWWSGHPQFPAPGGHSLLASLEQQGLRSLEKLGKTLSDIEGLEFARTPGDSLVELLAAIPHPAETLERMLMVEKMARDPDLWEAVIEEEALLQTPAEMLIEELSEDQLKMLSVKLKNLMG